MVISGKIPSQTVDVHGEEQRQRRGGNRREYISQLRALPDGRLNATRAVRGCAAALGPPNYLPEATRRPKNATTLQIGSASPASAPWSDLQRNSVVAVILALAGVGGSHHGRYLMRTGAAFTNILSFPSRCNPTRATDACVQTATLSLFFPLQLCFQHTDLVHLSYFSFTV
jgi:hypothetical protein